MSESLFDWLCPRLNVQFLLDHLPRNAGHVRWLPCEHVPVVSEKGDELEFLLRIELGTDNRRLGGLGLVQHYPLGWAVGLVKPEFFEGTSSRSL